jgi:phenylpropionate dioxygenase-like ring-hydroxylating dioxygenase large terminal subunit
VLSEEKHRQLTQVGPGTPMGNVLRRHLQAIAGIDDLAKKTVKPVRLMGEDLVLFKDRSGAYGLIDRHCAHRRADLSYGYVEPDGIRCNYHGWKFNAAGRCIAQPYEEVADPQARQKCKIQLKAYKVQPHAGMLWVNMGPDPKSLIRDPAINHRVVLPSDSRDFFQNGLVPKDRLRHPKWGRLLNHFIFHAGQQEKGQQAHEAATGVKIQPINVIDL